MSSAHALSFRLIGSRVNREIETLIPNDEDLLNVDVNERTISQRLAVYLDREFSGWNVDYEYNRKMGDTKTLDCLRHRVEGDTNNADDTVAKTVYPDIIIYRRRREDNLLVIEVNKSSRETRIDERKREAFTGSEYEYRFGLLLVIDGSSEPICTWYESGTPMEPRMTSTKPIRSRSTSTR